MKKDLYSIASKLVYNIEFLKVSPLPEDKESLAVFKLLQSVHCENLLSYERAFYNKETGSCGVLFKNVEENNYILSFAGTNLVCDGAKDMYTDIVGICLGQGEHYACCFDFYKQAVKDFGRNIVLTGHSLGGNIAMRVALEYNVPFSVVYNSAPLYLKNGVELFMEDLEDDELYQTRLKGYNNTVDSIRKKEEQFSGKIVRIISDEDIFTRISNIMSGIGHYVGDSYIIKNAGTHSIKKFLLKDQQNNMVDLIKMIKNNSKVEKSYLVKDFKPFSLSDIKLIQSFSKENISKLEHSIEDGVIRDYLLTAINKNPYKINFSSFVDNLITNIKNKQES